MQDSVPDVAKVSVVSIEEKCVFFAMSRRGIWGGTSSELLSLGWCWIQCAKQDLIGAFLTERFQTMPVGRCFRQ
jgi:hypothetical protein